MPGDPETAWNRVRTELRRDVPDFTFHVWLEPLEPVAWDGSELVLRVPDHIRTWVRERYLAPLRAAAARALAAHARVELVGSAWSAAAREPSDPRDSPRPDLEQLNPKYSFDGFVICDGSRFAHAAALAVAELPAQAYNPLFVYGRQGLGKTHLLQAIGNYVCRYGAGLKVRYATVETFTAEFVQAVRRGAGESFKDRFRQVDVLLIDDVQFLADKARTQEEFFHTFNTLYEGGSQLVITSDRPPRELGSLESRMQERFGAGLVVELAPPDRDARVAILRKRARQDGIGDVADDVLREIASRVSTSVRTLEGALVRAVAYASLRGEPLTREVAHTVLDHLYPAPRTAHGVEEIKAAAAGVFGVTPEDLAAYDRRPVVAEARQVAMYLARELTDHTLPEIGRRFGGRTHATVLHAHRKIASDIARETPAGIAASRLRAQLAVES